jgi:hypothetical protein
MDKLKLVLFIIAVSVVSQSAVAYVGGFGPDPVFPDGYPTMKGGSGTGPVLPPIVGKGYGNWKCRGNQSNC